MFVVCFLLLVCRLFHFEAAIFGASHETEIWFTGSEAATRTRHYPSSASGFNWPLRVVH